MIPAEVVQQACLAYGGGSFPARMRDALEAVLPDESELEGLIREIGERHGLTWEPDCSARSMLAKLSHRITLLECRSRTRDKHE
jgi:hypothetical protein